MLAAVTTLNFRSCYSFLAFKAFLKNVGEMTGNEENGDTAKLSPQSFRGCLKCYFFFDHITNSSDICSIPVLSLWLYTFNLSMSHFSSPSSFKNAGDSRGDQDLAIFTPLLKVKLPMTPVL